MQTITEDQVKQILFSPRGWHDRCCKRKISTGLVEM